MNSKFFESKTQQLFRQLGKGKPISPDAAKTLQKKLKHKSLKEILYFDEAELEKLIEKIAEKTKEKIKAKKALSKHEKERIRKHIKRKLQKNRVRVFKQTKQSALQLFNSVLTGVISVYQAGGHPIVVQRSPENYHAIVDVSPETGGKAGGSTLDQQTRFVDELADAHSLTGRKILRLMNQEEISDAIDIYLNSVKFTNTSPQAQLRQQFVLRH